MVLELPAIKMQANKVILELLVTALAVPFGCLSLLGSWEGPFLLWPEGTLDLLSFVIYFLDCGQERKDESQSLEDLAIWHSHGELREPSERLRSVLFDDALVSGSNSILLNAGVLMPSGWSFGAHFCCFVHRHLCTTQTHTHIYTPFDNTSYTYIEIWLKQKWNFGRDQWSFSLCKRQRSIY